MDRRAFLGGSIAVGAAASLVAEPSPAADESPALPSVLQGAPVLTGPAAESLTVLQAIRGAASGFVELQVAGEDWRRIDAETDGLLPFDKHVLKFRLPPLPAGKSVKYRVTATPIDFQNAYKIVRGAAEVSAEHAFRTLDPAAYETKFVIWNDTHENQETIAAVHAKTAAAKPDFFLWNGDQTNDIYDEAKMGNQYLAPGGLPIAADYPLAYARGNHDVRGPAARSLARFTGTPDDRFYYAFRSGPLAVLVMDTGEDKPDDAPVFGGLAAFAPMRRRQTEWLAKITAEAWFKSAPHKILCCHIPLWWTDERERGAWSFSKVCREAWLPQLQAAGVKLVISGHTHQAAWLPAGADRPIGQLVGGGPKFSAATIIEGRATADKLTLTMSDLTGKTLHEILV